MPPIDPDVLDQLPPMLATLFRREDREVTLVGFVVVIGATVFGCTLWDPVLIVPGLPLFAFFGLIAWGQIRARRGERTQVAQALAEHPETVSEWGRTLAWEPGDKHTRTRVIRIILDDGTATNLPWRTQHDVDRAVAELRAIAPCAGSAPAPRAHSKPKAKKHRRRHGRR
jgi:hypothetical protein